jgi:hypothetical protein
LTQIVPVIPGWPTGKPDYRPIERPILAAGSTNAGNAEKRPPDFFRSVARPRRPWPTRDGDGPEYDLAHTQLNYHIFGCLPD